MGIHISISARVNKPIKDHILTAISATYHTPIKIIPPNNKSIGEIINNRKFLTDLNVDSFLKFISILSLLSYFLSKRIKG